MYDTQIVFLAFLSTVIPVLLWCLIIKGKEKIPLIRAAIVFFFSGLGAMFYIENEVFFKEGLISIGIPLFFVFIIFGIFIEYFKNLTVRISGLGYFKNINQIMDMSFISALGFTFFENFFYFVEVFSGHDSEITSPITMIKYVLIKEFFILPIHIVVSGLFGYFYAVSLFANEDFKKKNKKTVPYKIFQLIFFFLPVKNKFKAIKIAQGTVISVAFYSLFFLTREYDFDVKDVTVFFGVYYSFIDSINEKLLPVISFLFFKFGTIILFNLLDNKNSILKAEKT